MKRAGVGAVSGTGSRGQALGIGLRSPCGLNPEDNRTLPTVLPLVHLPQAGYHVCVASGNQTDKT